MPTARTRRLAPLALVLWLGACAVARAQEAARLVEVLAIAPGMKVADVGAGDGEWALALADAVGDEGTVYATEVEEDLVAALQDLALERGNLVAVLGNQGTTGLPPGCCDAILLRMVYHHFTDAAAMRASLLAALRPGGRIAVVDIMPQAGWRHLAGVPDRGGHGIAISDLIAEMTGAGFVLHAMHKEWRSDDEDRYCVVFTAGEDS